MNIRGSLVSSSRSLCLIAFAATLSFGLIPALSQSTPAKPKPAAPAKPASAPAKPAAGAGHATGTATGGATAGHTGAATTTAGRTTTTTGAHTTTATTANSRPTTTAGVTHTGTTAAGGRPEVAGRGGVPGVTHGNLAHAAPVGARDRVSPNGNAMRVRANGRPADFHDARRGMDIHHNLVGGRRVEMERRDGSRLYYERGRPGYIGHPYAFRGHEFQRRS